MISRGWFQHWHFGSTFDHDRGRGLYVGCACAIRNESRSWETREDTSRLPPPVGRPYQAPTRMARQIVLPAPV
jgi:hypothetical protein